MKSYIRLIDTRTQGNRNDVTPIFADHDAFAALVEDLVQPFSGKDLDCVAGIDALGFILGVAVAMRLGVGFVPLRKGGKLPVAVDAADFIDYTGQSKRLELRKDAIRPGQRVLLVDEWVETGAQVSAGADLIERHGAIVTGIATINMDDNAQTRSLRQRYFCHSVWQSECWPQAASSKPPRSAKTLEVYIQWATAPSSLLTATPHKVAQPVASSR